jgi:hypothetical protein
MRHFAHFEIENALLKDQSNPLLIYKLLLAPGRVFLVSSSTFSQRKCIEVQR